MGHISYLAIAFIFLSAFTSDQQHSLQYPDEKHFSDMRQLTFGGDNAEAYWSFNDKMLVFQSTTRHGV